MQPTDNSRRLSKRFTTELYADQLAPLYPHLKLSQIKAALVLTENNMHECRLILDLKNRFVANFHGRNAKLGCTNPSKNDTRNGEDLGSYETSTVTVNASSSSSAYYGDISGSASEATKLEEKPHDEKVGVIIIRNKGGYKACPL